ncbi:hypothetical protein GE061_014866 [Apolygus lucorum]|uniref:DRBM domain-containing protein n=1 Tax=Apolygus lucorum TaxID=248454 RepID=A0A8S9XJF6_APOLU|nr:hypothetical protein GE061_014866 [Apolygus lucorum]
MSALSDNTQVYESSLSPISILHEMFPGKTHRPFFTFTVQQNYPSLLWLCTVEVPSHGTGNGVSSSKQNAKSKACVDVLDKLGYDVSRFDVSDHFNNNVLGAVKNYTTNVEEKNVDAKCKTRNCFNACCILKVKSDPNGELEPQFFRLYLAAISEDIKTKHMIGREQNPYGYLEMLCRKVHCELPTLSVEYKDVIFVTTVKLGPWTASGSAPNKKHSKYIATSSLITGIEEHGKQH